MARAKVPAFQAGSLPHSGFLKESPDQIRRSALRLELIAEAVQPDHTAFVAEPCPLPFRIAARVALRIVERLAQVEFSSQHLQGLPIAMRLQRLHRLGITHRQDSPDLFDQSGFEHPRTALIEAPVELLAGRIERELEHAEPFQGVATGGETLRKAAARQDANLQRADQFVSVGGVDARRCFGIESAEQAMEQAGALGLARGQSLAQFFVAAGAREQAVHQGTEVKARTTHHQGQVVSVHDLPQHQTGPAGVLAGCERLVGICDINQMMRDAPAVGWREFGRPDVEPAIDLERVAVDDLAIELLGQMEAKLALAGAGGPNYGNHGCERLRPHRLQTIVYRLAHRRVGRPLGRAILVGRELLARGVRACSVAREPVKAMLILQKLVILFLLAALAAAQQGVAGAVQDPDSRASAYYHFAMGHLYAELAGMHGNRSEYVDKAIEHYKAAIQADPGASFLAEELTDLYVQAGRLREAVLEAEQMLKRNPNNVEAHRLLGRIYVRMIGDPAAGRLDEGMLRRATEQFQKVTEKDPSDIDAWVTLGRLHRMAQNSVEAEKAFRKALELDPDNEYALHGLALLFSDLGDTKTAIQMWQRLAERNPHPRVLRALASSLTQARDYRGAVETLRRALQLAPRDTEIKRELAENLLLKEDYDEAARLFEELAQEQPRDSQYPLRLSQIYRQQRKLSKAREAHERAQALDPASLEVQYNEVNLLEAEGQFTQAIARLKQILDRTARVAYAPPERANRIILLERLGLLCRSSEQPEEAVAAFRQMAELDPDLGPRAAAQVIETYRASKQFTRAEQEAEAAVQQYPNDRTIRLLRASLLADLGRAAEARAEAQRLLEAHKDRETYLALAQLFEKTKDFHSMAQVLEEAERLSESEEDKEVVHFMRGAMYERMKKFAEAEAEFRKVLKMNPKNASALNYLGYMFADREVNLEEALELIRQAVELEPYNGAFLDSLGWVYYRLGRLDEAERYLRLALERVPRDPTVNDHLGDVYYRQGRLKEAIAQWQISLKEWESGSKAEFDPEEIAKIQKKLEGAKTRLAREAAKGSPPR